MKNRFTALAVIALLPLATACSRTAATVAAAGATAAGVIAYNDRGAETNVDVGVTSLANATEAAFRDLGITLTERETQDDGIELKGSQEDWKIVVDIEYDDDDRSRSDVEVSVSKDQVNYDKSRAETIMRRILSRAGR